MAARRQSCFITGTDTGVGKTYVPAALITLAARRHIDAVPMKPVQTGCRRRGQHLFAPDLQFALRGLKRPLAPLEKAVLCPYRFHPACSPHRAARLAGVTIRLGTIAQIVDTLLRLHSTLIIEGAGGVLAPLGPDRTMLDLMRVLGMPVVLVARAGLGTLNHTLLSLNELRRARLTVRAIVINQGRGPWGALERDNAQTLAAWSGLTVLRLPRLPGRDPQRWPLRPLAALAKLLKSDLARGGGRAPRRRPDTSALRNRAE